MTALAVEHEVEAVDQTPERETFDEDDLSWIYEYTLTGPAARKAFIESMREVDRNDPAVCAELLALAHEMLVPALPAADPLRRWIELGKLLAEAGGIRLALAIEVATREACGGSDVGPEEEDQIVTWFVDQVRETIARGGMDGAAAVWHIVVADWNRYPRCRSTAMADVDLTYSDEDGADEKFFAELLVGAEHYARVVIAGLDDREADQLRELVAHSRARDKRGLDRYAPFNNTCVSDRNPHEILEEAAADFVIDRSNHGVAECTEQFAFGCSMMHADYELGGVFRMGMIAWLAQRGLSKPRKRAGKAGSR